MGFDARQFARLVRHSEEEIQRQLADCRRQGWVLVIEHTADPSPENRYWSQWGVPLYDPEDPDLASLEIDACRTAFPDHYVRVNACETGRGQALIRHRLLVHSPEQSNNLKP